MRIDKEKYYLNIADNISQRGTCLRRNYGAVIVKNDEIISTGYTGSPRGCKNCIDIQKCIRDEYHIPSGTHYELCKSVHAEMNAIISAKRSDMIGADLYLFGRDYNSGKALDAEPCLLCSNIILNSGISRIICGRKLGSFFVIMKDDLVKIIDEKILKNALNYTIKSS